MELCTKGNASFHQVEKSCIAREEHVALDYENKDQRGSWASWLPVRRNKIPEQPSIAENVLLMLFYVGASLFLHHQNRLQWHLWSWADLTPCWIPFRWGVPAAHPTLQMLLFSEKRELNKPGSPFLLGWTQRQSDMENRCSVPWTMYLVEERCQHFVLTEEKAETRSATIQAGSSQWL